MKSKVGFVYLVLLLSLRALAWAELDLRAAIDSLDRQARELQSQFKTGGTDPRGLLRQTEVQIKFLDSLEEQIDSEMLQKLSEIRDVPAGDPLRKLKNNIWGGIEWTLGEKLATKLPANNPLFALRIDRDTGAMIQSHILQGGDSLDAVVRLFELCSAQTDVVGYQLFFQDIAVHLNRKIEKPERTDEAFLDLGDFIKLQIGLQIALDKTRAFFPALPEFPVIESNEDGEPEEESGRHRNQELDRKREEAFLATFVSIYQPLSPSLSSRLQRSYQQMVENVRDIEKYHLARYPQPANDARLGRLEEAIWMMPSHRECFRYARGTGDLLRGNFEYVSNFEDPPCRPPEFNEALKRYVDYYRKKVGYDFHSFLMGAIGNFILRSNEFKDFQSEWDKQLSEIDQHVQTASYPTVVKERWPLVRQRIAKIEALVSSLAKGVELHDFVERVLTEVGLKPRFGGFNANYTLNIAAAEKLLKRFSDPKSHLSEVPQKVERIDVATSCGVFESEDYARSPWVSNTTGFVPPEEMSPQAVNSARLQQRLVWFRKAKIGNVAAIQNPYRREEILAGLSAQTAVMLMVPNIVHVKLLLSQNVGKNLRSLGIRNRNHSRGTTMVDNGETSVSSLMQLVEDHYQFPAWSTVIGESRRVFESFIGGFKKERQGADSGSSVADGNNWVDLYRKRYREEMARAAWMIRWWQWQLKEVEDAEARYTSQPGLVREFLQRVPWQHATLSNPGVPLEMMYRLVRRTYINAHQFYELLRTPRYGQMALEAMSTEMYRALVNHPVDAKRLWNSTLGPFHQKREAIELGINYLLYMYPALKLKYKVPGWGGRTGFGERELEWWQTYEDKNFDEMMTGYLEVSVGEVNRLISIESASKVLDLVAPNLMLMNTVLKYHPDQKLKLCEEYKDQAVAEARWQSFLAGGTIMATLITPVFWPAGMALAGSVIYFSGDRKDLKASIYEHASTFDLAASAQLDYDTVADNPFVLRELGLAANEAIRQHYFLVAVNAVTLGEGAIYSFSQLSRVGVTSYLWKLPGRVGRSLGGNAEALAQLTAPFRRVGARFKAWNDEWRAIQWFRMPRPLPLWTRMIDPYGPQGVIAVLEPGFELLFRFFGNMPLSMAGLAWGEGLVGEVGFYGFMTADTALGIYLAYAATPTAIDRTMMRLEKNPQIYGPLVEGVYSGKYGYKELVRIFQSDLGMGTIFGEELIKVIEEIENHTKNSDSNPVKKQKANPLLREKLDQLLASAEEAYEKIKNEPGHSPAVEEELSIVVKILKEAGRARRLREGT